MEVSWSDALPEYVNGETCYRVEQTVTTTDRCGNETIETYQINIVDTVAPGLYASPILNIECSDYLGDSSTGAQYVVTDADNGIGFYVGAPLGIWEGQTSFQVDDDCTFDSLHQRWRRVVVTWVDVQIGKVAEATPCTSVPTLPRTSAATHLQLDGHHHRFDCTCWVNEAGDALSAQETCFTCHASRPRKSSDSIDHESLFMATDLCDADSTVCFSSACERRVHRHMDSYGLPRTTAATQSSSKLSRCTTTTNLSSLRSLQT